MNGLFTKVGRVGVVATVLALVVAGEAFAAQGGRKQPDTDICVAKTQAMLDQFDVSGFTSIQAAVNAAKPGQIIEILDEAEYPEQVTIYGGGEGDTCKWAGVTPGKNGITIRYVPQQGAAAPWNHPRPTIKFRDTKNTSPTTEAQAATPGDQIGNSGNFETCGALRIIRAKGVTIEGIAVDGISPFAFGATGVWVNKACNNKKSDLFHGNAAIALAIAGGVTIRDCDLKNAYFGISIKDRNTGGVFGNPNPSDNDVTVPLSGFGKVGAHLFEYNKINNNVVGFFFESAWDLGSTARYNLIYSNKVNKSLAAGVGVQPDNQNGGAFMFKDMYLSPVAIYNNTLYDNTGNFLGNWQVGGQHLIFNNIFSKSSPSQNPGNDHMSLDGKFPYRMHNCVFSIDASKVQAQCQQNYNCAANSAIAPGGCFVAALQDNAAFPQMSGSSTSITNCSNTGQTERQNIVSPGALFPSMKGANNTAITLPAASEIRWLQTEGGAVGQGGQTVSLPTLFKSLTPSSADFLVPDWDNENVQRYIMNKGWKDAGIRNNDGSLADLGAIPSTGVRQTTVGRIIPTNVVLLSGTGTNYTGKTNFNFKVESGEITNLSVQMLRWIAPLPDNKQDANCGESGGDWPNRMNIVPTGAIHPINNPSVTGLQVGSNTGNFTATGATTNTAYGFFEIIIKGKDANGKDVTSDVGFLPYRKLDYIFKLVVKDANGRTTTSVKAGEKYTLDVSVEKSGANFTETISEVAYDLLSDATALMYQDPSPSNPLVSDKNVKFPKTYPAVYFTRADPNETISASGVYVSGSNRLPILGTLDIEVKPGAPAKVEFLNPLPKSQGAPATINRGAPFEVRIEVQDKYGNAVDVAEPVTVKSLDMGKGNVGTSANGSGITATAPASAIGTSDPKTGVATVYAMVTGGNPREEFDLVATIAANPTGDTGRLRIGRSSDNLRVFYADAGANGNTKQDMSVDIEGNVGEWFKVTVKVAGAGDTLVTSRTGMFVLVDPSDPGLLLSATEGGAAETMFPLTNGIATFYVGANADVFGACLDVSALRTKSPTDVDGSIVTGNRCEITFKKPTGSILRAVVYGDGHGRPDSLLIYYAATSGGSFTGTSPMALPDKVTLEWPTSAPAGVLITASKANITARSETVLHVNIAAVRGVDVPTGYTSFANDGRGLVTVYGGAGKGAEEEEDPFDLLDAVGPVLADDRDVAKGGGPNIIENLSPGVAPDTIIIRLSEQLRDLSGAVLKGTGTMYYTKEANPTNEPGATGGQPMEVLEAEQYDPATNAYKVVVTGVPDGLKAGNWVRLNPAGALADRAAKTGEGYTHPDNRARNDNRWVQLKLIEVAPTIVSAYYTSNPQTGKVDYAYVKFDKAVDINKWFVGTGGVIKIGGDKEQSITAANVGSLLSPDPTDPTVIIVDLAVAYTSSQSKIMTVGDIPVAFGYISGLDWKRAEGTAKDKAAPVLADTVYLKLGSILESDEKTPDTLVVVYSEQPHPDAGVKLTNPVTILTGGGECKPTLSDPVGSAASGSFYRVTYLVESMNCAIPKNGELVRINSDANFSDNVTPPNIQNAADNMKWPLKVIPGKVNWKITVKSNPFRSDPTGSRHVTVSLRPGVGDDAGDIEADAKVWVFDNLGNVVVDTLVTMMTESGPTGEYSVINWEWNGYNKKGRLVGTGTYLFKALCEIRPKGVSSVTGEIDKQRYSVRKSLGVVRQ